MKEQFVHKCVLRRQLDAQCADKALVWYRSITLVSQRNLNAQRLLKSRETIMSERTRQLREGGCTIHPFSDFRTIWDTLLVVSIYIIIIMESLTLTFEYTGTIEKKDISNASFVIYSINWILIADIIINCFTGYYDAEKKMIILDQKKIIMRYFKTKRIFVHIIFAIPWYFMASELRNMIPDYIEAVTLDMRDWFSIISMVRIIRINEVTNYLEMFEKNSTQNKIFWKMADLVVKASILVHYATCLELSVFGLVVSHLVDTKYANESWVVQEDFIKIYNHTFLGQYCKCLYRACSCLLLHGDGTSVNKTFEDRLLANILRLVGVFLHLYILSHMMLIVRSEHSGQRIYQSTLNGIDELVRHKRLPPKKKERILMYLEYKYENRFFNEKKIMKMLSPQLQREVRDWLGRRVVESFEYFSRLPKNVVDKIIECLIDDICLPGDVIIKAGSSGDSMYFLISGSVAVYAKNGAEITHLEDGSHFGEMVLISNIHQRSASVVAIEPCELKVLTRLDFMRILSPYPDLFEAIKRFSIHRFPTSCEYKKSQNVNTILL